jgi:putative spermidine/putrescine transport system substrate-binding protein
LICSAAPPGATQIVLKAWRLRLNETGGPLLLMGRITARIYVGDHFETEVDTQSGFVRVIVPAQVPPPPVGAECVVSAWPDGISFHRRATGEWRVNLSRRSFGRLAFATGLAGPSVFTRTAQAAPNPGDELIVGIWGGVQERWSANIARSRWSRNYGCKVRLVLGGTPERRARAYAERGRPSFDVIYLNIAESRQAVKDGVTQAPTGAVPQFAHLLGLAKNGGYGVAINPITIIYDKRKARAPVNSWRDLWNPEWKGRIAWPAFPAAQGAAGLLMSAKVWGGDEHNIDIAFRKIKELKPFAAISSSQDELYQMFDTGVCDIAIEFGSLSRKYAETRNPNLVIAAPKEGQAAALNVACITVAHATSNSPKRGWICT